MKNEVYFCDTYAIIEIIGGNKNYLPYTNFSLVTSNLNLMELYYAFLRDYGKKTADHYFDAWLGFAIRMPLSVVRVAMEFKLANKNDRLSYVDCMGYTFCVENGIPFLTGDIKFEKKEMTEYVK